MNESPPANSNIGLVCPSCGRDGATWRVLPLSTRKLRRWAFVLVGLGTILMAGFGIAYLVAETADGGSTRPTVRSGTEEKTTMIGENVPPTPGTGVAIKSDTNPNVSPARARSVIGMLLAAGCLFVGSVGIFAHKKTLICPGCHAHSMRSGGGEDHVAVQAARNVERRHL